MTTPVPTYRQTQVAIKNFIQHNGLKPGNALPTEEELAQEIGVSRKSLSEALKALDSLGIVESKEGDAIYVKAFTFDSILENLPYAMSMTDSHVRNLLYARAYLELGAIPDVVRYAQPHNLQRLRELASTMAECASRGEPFPDVDHDFHIEMYRCLDNQFLDSLIDVFWRAFNRMNSETNAEPLDQETLEGVALDHLFMVEMLEQRDTFGLVSAHRKHFQQLFGKHPLKPFMSEEASSTT